MARTFLQPSVTYILKLLLMTKDVLCCLNAGEDVVFIANDWHTALLPCYLKSMYKSRGIYKSAKVMTASTEGNHL